jgi:hypothetical protein
MKVLGILTLCLSTRGTGIVDKKYVRKVVSCYPEWLGDRLRAKFGPIGA